MKDQDGEWEVHSGYRLLVKPSVEFEEKRAEQRAKAAIQQAERDVVQTERNRCIEHLKKLPDLSLEIMDRIIAGLTKAKFSELTLEMSFEDIIQSVRANREAKEKESQ